MVAAENGRRTAERAGTSSVSRWKRLRYRLEWVGLVVAAKLIPLLSRKACFHFAQIAGAIASVFDREGRAVALSNLEAAFGSEMTARHRAKVTRESYQHFTRTMIDLFWAPRVTTANLSEYVELENFEQWKADMGPGDSYIAACYHYSNFEWMSLAVGLLGLHSTIITQEFKNSLLDPIFKRLREVAGHNIVPREGGVGRLYRALRRQGRTAVLVDLTLRPSMPTVAIDCFGLKTSVTFAHAWLHERTGVPIIPTHCEPLPDGRYRIVFHRKIDLPKGATRQQVVQACWDSFEPYVRRNPAPWLWMYKHWRYKPKHADRPYPFYANEGEGFERLLQRSASNAAMSTPD
jgi:lauroyl/myristoyl acyltransferase